MFRWLTCGAGRTRVGGGLRCWCMDATTCQPDQGSLGNTCAHNCYWHFTVSIMKHLLIVANIVIDNSSIRETLVFLTWKTIIIEKQICSIGNIVISKFKIKFKP